MLKFQSPLARVGSVFFAIFMAQHCAPFYAIFYKYFIYVRMQLPAYFEVHFGLSELPCCQLLWLMASLLLASPYI